MKMSGIEFPSVNPWIICPRKSVSNHGTSNLRSGDGGTATSPSIPPIASALMASPVSGVTPAQSTMWFTPGHHTPYRPRQIGLLFGVDPARGSELFGDVEPTVDDIDRDDCCAAASAKPGRQERREGSIEFVRLFDVRDVTGFGDFDQLAVRQILERFAAEHRPVAERLDRVGRGVAAEEDAAVALADDEQDRHLQQMGFVAERVVGRNVLSEGREPGPTGVKLSFVYPRHRFAKV